MLVQALTDGALGVHLFHDTDDGCLRMLYCLDVPVTPQRDPPVLPTGPRERRWYEMVPPPTDCAPRFFDVLRRRAALRGGRTQGTLLLRIAGRDMSATVLAPRPDDVRVYFTADHVPIRPKLRRHYEELGRPDPNAGDPG